MFKSKQLFRNILVWSLAFSSQLLKAEDPINLVFIGQSGAGKSAMVNMIYNLASGLNHDSKHHIVVPMVNGPRVVPVNVEGYTNNSSEPQSFKGDIDSNFKEASSTESQTKAYSVYSLQVDGKMYNFIDTPGFSDNQGQSEDDIIANVTEALEKHEVNAVCLVVKESDSRVTHSMKSMMAHIQKYIYPEGFNDSLKVCVSHSSGDFENVVTAVKDLGIEVEDDDEAKLFGFQNGLLSRNPDKKKSKREENNDPLDWKENLESFERLASVVAHTKLSSKRFIDVKALLSKASEELSTLAELDQEALTSRIDLMEAIKQVASKINSQGFKFEKNDLLLDEDSSRYEWGYKSPRHKWTYTKTGEHCQYTDHSIVEADSHAHLHVKKVKGFGNALAGAVTSAVLMPIGVIADIVTAPFDDGSVSLTGAAGDAAVYVGTKNSCSKCGHKLSNHSSLEYNHYGLIGNKLQGKQVDLEKINSIIESSESAKEIFSSLHRQKESLREQQETALEAYRVLFNTLSELDPSKKIGFENSAVYLEQVIESSSIHLSERLKSALDQMFCAELKSACYENVLSNQMNELSRYIDRQASQNARIGTEKKSILKSALEAQLNAARYRIADIEAGRCLQQTPNVAGVSTTKQVILKIKGAYNSLASYTNKETQEVANLLKRLAELN